ncbi:MAG: PKD domain-containing protein [Saprospiraceae bacterium]
MKFEKYSTSRNWLIALLFLVAGPVSMYATHIIGGSIRYQCLGNNQYEVTLRLYRDCFYGASDAQFDDPASIGVFDGVTDELLFDLRVPFIDDDTLNSFLFDPCFVVPPSVCVHTTTYVDTVELVPRAGGYIIAYQRCCRNETINNIIAPVRTGATYSIELTEFALQECNNSPQFRSWPPIFICAGTTLNYDHGADDVENDSLVYKLCTPNSGASLGAPQPQPPANPPYDSVRWNTAGGYGLNNMLGAGDPLEVDRMTGLMTGQPEQVGQFVVGVCIEEYRNGQLLSRSVRDFQYNVGICGRITAAAQFPTVQCDNRTVTFQNLSQNAFDFEWLFDYPNSSPFSLEFEPTFTFPDTGVYTVALVAEPTSSCSDTIFQDIYLQDNSLTADFELVAFECVDSTEIIISDLSTDFVSPPNSWNWQLTFDNQPGLVVTSNQQNPTFRVRSPDIVYVKLTVGSENGCEQVLERTFPLDSINPGNQIPDTLYICQGNSVQLNPNGDPNFFYNWTPATGLSATNIANPTANPSVTTTYIVGITSQSGFCVVEKDVTVIVQADPQLDFQTELGCDDRTISFINTSGVQINDFEWLFDDPTNPGAFSDEANPQYTFPDEGFYDVTLYLGSSSLCQDTIVKTIEVQDRELNPDFTFDYIDCSPGSLNVDFNQASSATGHNITGYNWVFGNNIGIASGPNQQIIINNSQQLNVKLEVVTDQGCRDSIDKNLNLFIVEQYPNDIQQICIGDTVGLNPGFNGNYTYQWSPAIYLDDPNSPNPRFSGPQSQSYSVQITAIGADTCEVVWDVDVVVPAPIGLDASDDEITCDSFVTLQANTTTTPPATLRWYNPSGQQIALGNSVRVPVSGITRYRVEATDSFGCKDDNVISVAGGPVDAVISPDDSLCTNDPILLNLTNLDPNDQLSITWSPSANIISGANTATPIITDRPGNYTFFVNAVSQFGCEYFDTVNIVSVDPDLTLAFGDDVACNGRTVDFNNLSQNGFDFVWNFGDPNDPAAGSTMDNPTYTYADTGTFNVLLTIAYPIAGCTDTLVQPVVISEEVLSADFAVNYDDCSEDEVDLLFTYLATGVNNITDFEWNIDPFGTFNVQNPNINVTSDGTITATLYVTDNVGCMDSLTREIDIELFKLALPDTPLIQCVYSDIFLNPNFNPDYAYEWSPANLVDDPNAPNPRFIGTSSGTVNVEITSFGIDTCSVVKEVEVVVPQPLTVAIDGDSLTCGNPIDLMANATTNSTFVWSNSQGTNLGSNATISVMPQDRLTYYLEATDDFGCKDFDTIQVINRQVDILTSGTEEACENLETRVTVTNLDPNDQLTYNWQPSNRIIGDPNSVNPLVRTDRVGSNLFFVIAENQYGCRDTGSVELLIAAFTPGVDDMIEICKGISTELNPNANPDQQYEWSPVTGLDDPNAANPNVLVQTSTTYQAIITQVISSGLVCIDTIEVEVDVRPPFEVEVSDGDTLCERQMVELNVTSATTGLSYEWSNSISFNPILGEDNNIFVNRLGTNTYYVRGIDDLGCMDTAEVTLSIVPIEVEVEQDTTICFGEPETVELFNQNEDQILTYQWSPVTGIDMGATTSSPTFNLEETTTFTVTMSNQYGCEETIEVTVDVVDLGLTVDVSAEPDSLLPGQSSQLLVTENPGYSYFWEPSFSLNDNSVFNPIARPNETTEYTVQVTDENGCVTNRTVLVTVYDPICEPPYIFLPNAFSPNNDGENDVLYLLGNFVDEINLVIYNRWGEKVFETNDQNIGWDGTYKGVPLSPDVYGYYLTVRCINQEEYFEKGNITLMR